MEDEKDKGDEEKKRKKERWRGWGGEAWKEREWESETNTLQSPQAQV